MAFWIIQEVGGERTAADTIFWYIIVLDPKGWSTVVIVSKYMIATIKL